MRLWFWMSPCLAGEAGIRRQTIFGEAGIADEACPDSIPGLEPRKLSAFPKIMSRSFKAFSGTAKVYSSQRIARAAARTREAMHNSCDKNDPKDAQVLLQLLGTGVTQRALP